MSIDVARELTALKQMTVGQLQDRYAEVFGEPIRSRHHAYLVRRIVWRLQALAEGGLSERTIRRAEELAHYADARVTPPRWATTPERIPGSAVIQVPVTRDPRLPPPGTVITREYKGQTLQVAVLPDGFEYKGERYRSLTAIAKAVNGSHANGFAFFRLGEK